MALLKQEAAWKHAPLFLLGEPVGARRVVPPAPVSVRAPGWALRRARCLLLPSLVAHRPNSLRHQLESSHRRLSIAPASRGS